MQVVCPSCGREAQVSVGQHTDGIRLLWSRSTSCAGCGHATEEDDVGFPPEPVRQALTSTHGRWSLRLGDERERRAAVGALRAVLQLDLAEAASLLRREDGVLWSGTRTEARWLAARVASRGVRSVSVTQDPPEASSPPRRR